MRGTYRTVVILLLLATSGGAEPGVPDLVTQANQPVSAVRGKKLVRVASELCSQLLRSPSISEADLPDRVLAWQETGLDGLVFSMASHDPARAERNMTGQWWNLAPLTYDEFIPEIEAFQSVTNWGRLTDNFLWSSIAVWATEETGGTAMDWFSDDHWETVRHNVRLHARIARECGFKGVLLDVEQYSHHGQGPWRYPFNYRHYAAAAGSGAAGAGGRIHSREEAAAKVYQRAKEYAEAICGAFPNLTLFLIPAIYRPAGLTDEEVLFPAFVDGLAAGLDAGSPLVIGSEYTYVESQYREMAVIRDGTIAQMLSRSADPERLERKLSFAAGIWADCGHGAPDERFSDTDVSQNVRDPVRHRHAVHNALAVSERYGWLYGERSFFLVGEPTPLMRRYFRANVEGHAPQDLFWRPEPKWDMTDYGGLDREMAAKDAAFWLAREREGYRAVADVPAYWHFFFDTEQRGKHISRMYDHSGWPRISTLTCWQSQSTKANGEGIYRTWFDVPAAVDPEQDRVFLAFGSLPLGRFDGWMIVRFNDKGYGAAEMIDVSARVKPGEPNFLVVEVINRSGPGGPLGHVKLLVRDREIPTAENAGDEAHAGTP